MSEWRLDPIGDDEADDGDAPICSACGVTALPAAGNAPSGAFTCANDDCDVFGEVVEPSDGWLS